MKVSVYILILLISLNKCLSQDPHYSQFFMAPQLVNPASAGSSSSDWRILCNYRQQWNNAETPFNTFSLTYDMKITGKEPGDNTLGLITTLMADRSMDGTFKSNYGGAALAYHVNISTNHKIGLGIHSTFGQRSIDFSNLSFASQFNGRGFDVSLPSGESSLSNMKAFISLGAGFLYNYHSESINVDVGYAQFHLNKPVQTFISDENQKIPYRYVAHLNIEKKLSQDLTFSINSIYQKQSSQSYFAGGGSFGLDISNSDFEKIFYAGSWYRQADAIYPYVGLLLGSVQLGLTYDITLSKQNLGPNNPRSLELSLVWRKAGRVEGVIPCPWK
jgi:type IX secretion system PorP/SprF family membrane protein